MGRAELRQGEAALHREHSVKSEFPINEDACFRVSLSQLFDGTSDLKHPHRSPATQS